MKTKYFIRKILRKIYHFIGFISLFIIFLTPVHAADYVTQEYYPSRGNRYGYPNAWNLYEYTNYEEFISDSYNKDMLNTLYSSLMTTYDSYKATYPYYSIGLSLNSSSDTSFDHTLVLLYMTASDSSQDKLDFYNPSPLYNNIRFISFYYDGTYYSPMSDSSSTVQGMADKFYNAIDINEYIFNFPSIVSPSFEPQVITWVNGTPFYYYSPPNAFETNNIGSQVFLSGFNVVNSNNQVLASYSQGSTVPYLYTDDNLYDPDNSSNLATVNLDDYEYVILSLKNYDITTSFQTSFSVKGQIGITPIYNYGQTSKDQITGVRVQDRCNITYSDYTSMPFYILQSDIQNNSIYAVKSCSSGSSFKYDTTVFDITYITQSNVDNPTVTINGKTYNVIPYVDLPSTATKNELENYIPGAVGDGNGAGGLAGAIQNSQKQMAEIWHVFTYFTDYVNQIFNALPPTLSNLLISAFACALVLGLIKLFVH